VLDIIAKRMKLVSVQIELLGFACRTSRSATFLDFSSISFTNGLSLSTKNIKSFLMVHPKFGQCMPMSQVKQKLEYLFIVRLQEETFKNWYHGLKTSNLR
jgi:hypothetical protein